MDEFYSDIVIDEVDNYVPEESGKGNALSYKDYEKMIDENNQSIRKFLIDLKAGSGKDDLINRDATRNTQDFLDTTISRTITINVPLIPAYTDLRTLLYEITENGVKNFLIRKNKYIELITSQSVFEYVANAYDPDDTIMDNIRRQRIPFKPRTMTIRDAFNFMIEKNLPLILIDWTEEEKKRYARIDKFVYPNVCTLSQIYTMICQRLIDDDLLPSSVDVHGHDSFYGDEESDSGDVPYEHNRTGSEEIFDGKKRKKHYSQYGDEETKEDDDEEEVEDTEEENNKTFKSKFKYYWSILSYWLTKLIMHWIYRTLLILFVAYDMICCLFYIIDYNNYIQNQFYVFNGLLMIADSIARYCFVNHSYHCLHDTFELFSLILSSGLSFLSQFDWNTRSFYAFAKTIIICRLLRSYIFFVREKSYVSKTIRKWFNRHRSQKEEENLDLSDITKRIIAMSWPGNNIESVWRNDIDDVERYLNNHHMGHYWVINLCAEGSYSKKPEICFGGRNTHYCIEDHNACSLNQIQMIVNHCNAWLLQDNLNVIAIHCKGGKGRTGMIIACLLLKQGIKDSPEAALSHFAQKRTCSNKEDESKKTKIQCVSSPSQIRYVFYYNFLLTHELKQQSILHLYAVEIPTSNNYWDELFSSLKFEVSIQHKVFQPYEGEINCESLAHSAVTEKIERLIESAEMKVIPSRQVARIEFERPIALSDDIKVTIQCTGSITDSSSFVWFNTNFITRKDTLFIDDEIDSSGQKARSDNSRSYTLHSIQSEKSSVKLRQNSTNSMSHSMLTLRNFSSDDEESDSSRNYGTFTASATPSTPIQKEEETPSYHLPSNLFYIRLQFADKELSDDPDPASQIIHREEFCPPASQKNLVVKKTLRVVGDTRKKAEGFVKEGTNFIVNTSGKISNSIVSLVNGDTRESVTPSQSVSSISSSQVNSSTTLLSKKHRHASRHNHIPDTDGDVVIIPEIRKNMDESD